MDYSLSFDTTVPSRLVSNLIYLGLDLATHVGLCLSPLTLNTQSIIITAVVGPAGHQQNKGTDGALIVGSSRTSVTLPTNHLSPHL